MSPEDAVGIEDVARAAGVATSTVSRALRNQAGVSEKTRVRIRELADSLGYVATSSASRLASGRTRAVGVLLPTVDRWFFSRVTDGIDAALALSGYDLVLFSLGGHGSNRRDVFDRALRGRKIDGLIVLGFPLSADEEHRLRAAGIPVVTVGHGIRGVPSLTVDEDAVVRAAVAHLVSLGHEDIGFVEGGLEFEMSFEVPQLRARAFRAALTEHGLRVREHWLERAQFTVPSGYDAGSRLCETYRREGRPTAVLASSDEMAFGFIAALRDGGLSVPGDMSVLGIDDHTFSAAFGLTTVRQDARGQGFRAAELVLRILSGAESAESLSSPLPPQPHALIVRRSTAAPSVSPPSVSV